jgi:hypothetical protein
MYTHYLIILLEAPNNLLNLSLLLSVECGKSFNFFEQKLALKHLTRIICSLNTYRNVWIERERHTQSIERYDTKNKNQKSNKRNG